MLIWHGIQFAAPAIHGFICGLLASLAFLLAIVAQDRAATREFITITPALLIFYLLLSCSEALAAKRRRLSTRLSIAIATSLLAALGFIFLYTWGEVMGRGDFDPFEVGRIGFHRLMRFLNNPLEAAGIVMVGVLILVTLGSRLLFERALWKLVVGVPVALFAVWTAWLLSGAHNSAGRCSFVLCLGTAPLLLQLGAVLNDALQVRAAKAIAAAD